ncbi:hypothetical protein R5R35_007254 [Gryllus longicercus]|uniref:Uncharacterized protein n=1 Tax=Gryllus longicercus TaxID=2509291 RepID=A0AAN9W2I9_9ORTH
MPLTVFLASRLHSQLHSQLQSLTSFCSFHFTHIPLSPNTWQPPYPPSPTPPFTFAPHALRRPAPSRHAPFPPPSRRRPALVSCQAGDAARQRHGCARTAPPPLALPPPHALALAHAHAHAHEAEPRRSPGLAPSHLAAPTASRR